jgi:hypothetical protein
MYVHHVVAVFVGVAPRPRCNADLHCLDLGGGIHAEVEVKQAAQATSKTRMDGEGFMMTCI